VSLDFYRINCNWKFSKNILDSGTIYQFQLKHRDTLYDFCDKCFDVPVFQSEKIHKYSLEKIYMANIVNCLKEKLKNRYLTAL
jgi:hypothetical protein